MSMFMRLRTAGSLLFTKERASFTDRGSTGSIFLQSFGASLVNRSQLVMQRFVLL